jgi:hypothetical protein
MLIDMTRFLGVSLAALILVPVTANAQIKTIWSIFWLTPPLSCNFWGQPMTSNYYPPCKVGGVHVSICPQPTVSEQPFDQGKPITIVGWELMQILSDPTASGYMVIGSGNSGNPGADVFGMTGGVGTNMKNGTFPPDTGLPQGGNPGYSHIDVYGVCSGGKNPATLTQQALVTILYTSP